MAVVTVPQFHDSSTLRGNDLIPYWKFNEASMYHIDFNELYTQLEASIGGSGGGNYNFANGLQTLSDGSIGLGGVLLEDTSIDTTPFDLIIEGGAGNYYHAFRTDYNEDVTTTIHMAAGNIDTVKTPLDASSAGFYASVTLNNPQAIMQAKDDSSAIGIVLEADGTFDIKDQIGLKGMVYQANYAPQGGSDPRWIPDAAWVHSTIDSCVVIPTAWNGLSKPDNSIGLGGPLQYDTSISVGNSQTFQIVANDTGNMFHMIEAFGDVDIVIGKDTDRGIWISDNDFSFGVQIGITSKQRIYSDDTGGGWLVYDEDFSTGFRYHNDYRHQGIANAGDRWIPDWGNVKDYVDSSIDGLTFTTEFFQLNDVSVVGTVSQDDIFVFDSDGSVLINEAPLDALDYFYTKEYIDGSFGTLGYIDGSLSTLETSIDNSINELRIYTDNSLNGKVSKTGDTMTGNLFLNGGGLEVTQDVSFNQDFYVGGNAVFSGNVYVDGSLHIRETESVEVSTGFIILNSGQTGIPSPTMQAGVVVDRGDLEPYVFLFDESTEDFRIGIAVPDTSIRFDDASTQAVATREDNPTNGGYAVWNSALNRFDTTALAVNAWNGLTTTDASLGLGGHLNRDTSMDTNGHGFTWYLDDYQTNWMSGTSGILNYLNGAETTVEYNLWQPGATMAYNLDVANTTIIYQFGDPSAYVSFGSSITDPEFRLYSTGFQFRNIPTTTASDPYFLVQESPDASIQLKQISTGGVSNFFDLEDVSIVGDVSAGDIFAIPDDDTSVLVNETPVNAYDYFIAKEGDTSIGGELAIDGDLKVGISNYQYFGDINTDGSWRFYVDTSGNLTFEKRVAGTWTFSGQFT